MLKGTRTRGVRATAVASRIHVTELATLWRMDAFRRVAQTWFARASRIGADPSDTDDVRLRKALLVLVCLLILPAVLAMLGPRVNALAPNRLQGNPSPERWRALAGFVILVTGWHQADGVASLVIAAVMLHAAWGLLRESGRVFLEAAPRGVDVDAIGHAMVGVTGVHEVHDLHVWEVTSGFPALSAHVIVGQADDCHAARGALEQVLHDEFHIEHTTLQVEHEQPLLEIEVAQPRGRNSSAVDTGRPPGSGSP